MLKLCFENGYFETSTPEIIKTNEALIIINKHPSLNNKQALSVSWKLFNSYKW